MNICPRRACRGWTDHSFWRHWTPAYLREAWQSLRSRIRYTRGAGDNDYWVHPVTGHGPDCGCPGCNRDY